MQIMLSTLPEQIRGIYSDKRSGRTDYLPDRLRRLAPEVARSFAAASTEHRIVVSDMYRSPDGSLEAIRTRRGALRPSKSLHNYGLAIDVDVAATMAGFRFERKQALDEYLAAHNFICCRLDHKREFEDWHYSYLPGFTWKTSGASSTDEGEAELQRRYRKHWDALSQDLSLEQAALQRLRLYGGDLDGEMGPRTQKAREAFCRAWDLTTSTDPLYARTLALVAADVQVA